MPTITGRMSRHLPFVRFGVPWQDRIRNDEIDTGLSLDLGIDYAELERSFYERMGLAGIPFEKLGMYAVHDQLTVVLPVPEDEEQE